MSFKPSGEEQKWAKQQEIDLKNKLKEYISAQKGSLTEEILFLDSICPGDGEKLEKIEVDETGIFVYKCSFCGGIWINRKNAEKLFQSVEKSNKLIKYLAKIFNIKI